MKAQGEGEAITPLKLQKLIYFAHGWHLAVQGKPLIKEGVKAWPYGPVIPSIYDEYKSYGGQAIPTIEVDNIIEEGLLNDTITVKLLDKVWEEYGKLGAFQLSNMTHESDTPWQKTETSDVIPDEEIRKYFVEHARKRKQRS